MQNFSRSDDDDSYKQILIFSGERQKEIAIPKNDKKIFIRVLEIFVNPIMNLTPQTFLGPIIVQCNQLNGYQNEKNDTTGALEIAFPKITSMFRAENPANIFSFVSNVFASYKYQLSSNEFEELKKDCSDIQLNLKSYDSAGKMIDFVNNGVITILIEIISI